MSHFSSDAELSKLLFHLAQYLSQVVLVHWVQELSVLAVWCKFGLCAVCCFQEEDAMFWRHVSMSDIQVVASSAMVRTRHVDALDMTTQLCKQLHHFLWLLKSLMWQQLHDGFVLAAVCAACLLFIWFFKSPCVPCSITSPADVISIVTALLNSREVCLSAQPLGFRVECTEEGPEV